MILVILGVGVITQIVHFNATKQRSIAAKKIYFSFTVRLITMLSFEHIACTLIPFPLICAKSGGMVRLILGDFMYPFL